MYCDCYMKRIKICNLNTIKNKKMINYKIYFITLTNLQLRVLEIPFFISASFLIFVILTQTNKHPNPNLYKLKFFIDIFSVKLVIFQIISIRIQVY